PRVQAGRLKIKLRKHRFSNPDRSAWLMKEMTKLNTAATKIRRISQGKDEHACRATPAIRHDRASGSAPITAKTPKSGLEITAGRGAPPPPTPHNREKGGRTQPSDAE